MARAVTMQELTDWVAKNEKRTWSRNNFFSKELGTLEIKYLRFNLDTRDGKVFNVLTDREGVKADFRDEFDGSILELFEKRLDDYRNSSNS